MSITLCEAWGMRWCGASPKLEATGIQLTLFQPLFQGNIREKGQRGGMGQDNSLMAESGGQGQLVPSSEEELRPHIHHSSCDPSQVI